MTKVKATTFSVYLCRILFAQAILALLGAWLIRLNGWNFLDFGQTHFSNVAIVLSLFGIGMLLDTCSIRMVVEKCSVIVDPRWLGTQP